MGRDMDLRDRKYMSSIQSVSSPVYLSPAMASARHPSCVHPSARASAPGEQVYASPSATTRFSSDSCIMDGFPTVSSSSSLRPSSRCFHQWQVRSSAKPYETTSTSSTELEFFFYQLWDVMMEVRKEIERFQSNVSAAKPRPLPSVRAGDIADLTTHLHYEIDILAVIDACSADHFALDVRHLYDQFSQRCMRARSSTVSMVPNRVQSIFSHYRPHQQYLNSFSTPPLSHPNGFALSSSASAIPGEYIDTFATARPATRGHRLHSSPYNYHYCRLECGNQAGQKINQRAMEYDRRASPGHETPLYDGRFTSDPSSPRGEMQFMSSAHLGPGNRFHTHHQRMSQRMPRRVRKRRDEAEQTCLACSARETPEWRKGPTGPRTLCNACGLLYAKQCQKRALDLPAQGKRRKRSRAGREDMTQKERENSLLELQSAAQTRVNRSFHMGVSDVAPSSYSGNNTANEIGGSMTGRKSRVAINPNQQV